jgi:hypothetical protein
MGGFSFASVILSYFLVAGGLFTGQLAASYMKTSSEVMALALLAVGGFIGGFVAGRASRGSTIIEPAIGAIGVIATIVLMIAATDLGKAMWAASSNGTAKVIAEVAGATAIGAIGGAFVSEKFFGEATLSAFPWIIYVAFSTFGACIMSTIIAGIFAAQGEGHALEALAKMLFAGMGIGCVLSGIAAGASARTRPLGASFLGGAIGMAGYLTLISRLSPSESKSSDVAAGIAVFAAGGAILTLIGAVIGWFAVGKKTAG